MTESKSIADRLRKAREFRGLSLRQTVGRTGIPLTTLHRYEKAKTTPNLINVIKLAKAYNMNLDEIFTPESVTKMDT